MLILKSQESLTPHSRAIVVLSLRVRPKGCRIKAQCSKKDTEKAANGSLKSWKWLTKGTFWVEQFRKVHFCLHQVGIWFFHLWKYKVWEKRPWKHVSTLKNDLAACRWTLITLRRNMAPACKHTDLAWVFQGQRWLHAVPSCVQCDPANLLTVTIKNLILSNQECWSLNEDSIWNHLLEV